MEAFDDDQREKDASDAFLSEKDISRNDGKPPVLPVLSDEELLEETEPRLKAVKISWFESDNDPALALDDQDIARDMYAWSDAPTWIFPVIPARPEKVTTRLLQAFLTDRKNSPVSELRKLVKHSGIYALASVTTPLIMLILTPFLAHNLSPVDYGILTIINTAIGLSAGITQLGLASAFFRAYGYDYTSPEDKRDVVATATAMLCLTTTFVALMVALFAPLLANFLFGRSSLANDVTLAGFVVLLQNLMIPALAWLRVEQRPLLYSILSVSNTLVTLLATIVLVGVLRWGVAGAIVANGGGYAFVVLCTLPVIIFRAGVKIRPDIASSMLAFGLPLVLNFTSFWILQLSDRYLLSLFVSLVETAHYAVAYTLGSALSVVVMGPFALAWPSALFAIAKREDAAAIFKVFFRWFSLFLLFAAFGLSLVGTFFLNWLFPVNYHAVASIIPIIAMSIAFYGVYHATLVGVNVKRKTWLISLFSTSAALVNILFNLFLIPRYASSGAAISTLLAYIVLAAVSYAVNQRLYPIPFEVGIFLCALCTGIALYTGSSFLLPVQSAIVTAGLRLAAFVLYGICLGVMGMAPTWRQRWLLRHSIG